LRCDIDRRRASDTRGRTPIDDTPATVAMSSRLRSTSPWIRAARHSVRQAAAGLRGARGRLSVITDAQRVERHAPGGRQAKPHRGARGGHTRPRRARA